MKVGSSLLWMSTIAIVIGCHSNPKQNADVDHLLTSVSYETTTDSISTATTLPDGWVAIEPDPAKIQRSKIEPSKLSAKEIMSRTGDLVVAGAAAVTWGVGWVAIEIIKSSLGIDDDDDDDRCDMTPRGRAERNFQGWLDARDHWRDGKR